MKNVLVLCLLLTFVLTSCQSTPSRRVKRSVANASVFRSFIREVAEASEKKSAQEFQEQLEKNLKEFLRESKDDEHGNWVRMGISKEEAMKFQSLSEDSASVSQIKKWLTRNITTISKDVKPSVANKVFSKVFDEKGLINPYKNLADDAKTVSLANRRALMKGKNPTSSKPKTVVEELQERHERIISAVKKIEGDKKEIDQMLKAFEVSDFLITQRPNRAVHVLDSLESSFREFRATGRAPAGKGCASFNGKASEEILSIKAGIDEESADLIEEFVAVKGRKPSSKEVDDMRAQAFENRLGYSRAESKAAVKRLKNPPCRVY